MSSPTNLRSGNVYFELKGMDEYLKKIEASGKNIDDAVKEAVLESAEPIYSDIRAGLLDHIDTGASIQGLMPLEVSQDVNDIYTYMGIDGSAADKKAWHIVFVEYGGMYNRADPFVRKAFDENKSRVRKIQRDILKKWGMPVE